MQIEDVEQILAGDRRREVAVRLLDEQQIAELGDVAEKREIIRAAPRAFERAATLEQQARLIEQVERDVAERELLLEHGRMAAPLRQSVAEHQAIVAQTKAVLGEVVRHHSPRMPRGTL